MGAYTDIILRFFIIKLKSTFLCCNLYHYLRQDTFDPLNVMKIISFKYNGLVPICIDHNIMDYGVNYRIHPNGKTLLWVHTLYTCSGDGSQILLIWEVGKKLRIFCHRAINFFDKKNRKSYVTIHICGFLYVKKKFHWIRVHSYWQKLLLASNTNFATSFWE